MPAKKNALSSTVPTTIFPEYEVNSEAEVSSSDKGADKKTPAPRKPRATKKPIIEEKILQKQESDIEGVKNFKALLKISSIPVFQTEDIPSAFCSSMMVVNAEFTGDFDKTSFSHNYKTEEVVDAVYYSTNPEEKLRKLNPFLQDHFYYNNLLAKVLQELVIKSGFVMKALRVTLEVTVFEDETLISFTEIASDSLGELRHSTFEGDLKGKPLTSSFLDFNKGLSIIEKIPSNFRITEWENRQAYQYATISPEMLSEITALPTKNQVGKLEIELDLYPEFKAYLISALYSSSKVVKKEEIKSPSILNSSSISMFKVDSMIFVPEVKDSDLLAAINFFYSPKEPREKRWKLLSEDTRFNGKDVFSWATRPTFYEKELQIKVVSL